MWISEAFAQDGGAAGGGDLFLQFLPIILIFVVFYFLLIRPQQRKMKEHREMLGAVRRGDRIVTGGGIIGQVVKAGSDELTVEISEGVRIKVLRSTITSILAKPEPARGNRRRGRDRDRDEEDEADEADAETVEAEDTGTRGRR